MKIRIQHLFPQFLNVYIARTVNISFVMFYITFMLRQQLKHCKMLCSKIMLISHVHNLPRYLFFILSKLSNGTYTLNSMNFYSLLICEQECIYPFCFINSSTLMALICDLLESSVNIQQQLIQNKGFLVISYLLEKVRAVPSIVYCN